MPAYLIDLPIKYIRMNLLRNSREERIDTVLNSVNALGIQKPVLLDHNLTVILGGTRVEVAVLLKIKFVKCIIFTNKKYKSAYKIKSFDELKDISKLTSSEILDLNISGNTNRSL